MERYKAGMLARSLAGHDEGQIYVIIESEASYIYEASLSIITYICPSSCPASDLASIPALYLSISRSFYLFRQSQYLRLTLCDQHSIFIMRR